MTCECAKFLIDGINSTEIVWIGNGEQLNKEYYLISLTKQVTKNETCAKEHVLYK